MARSDLYRAYARGARGVRYRIDFIFWESSAGAVVPMAAVPTVHEMPDGIVELVNAPEWAYPNDFPTGIPQIDPWKLRVYNYRASGTAELENFRSYVQDYRKVNGGKIYDGSGYHSFDIYNCIRIYSDRGSDGATWTLIYEGEQRQDPEPDVTVHLDRGSVVEYSIQHLAHVITERLKMEWVCLMTRDTTSTAPWNDYHSFVADKIWKSGSDHYMWGQLVGEIFSQFDAKFEKRWLVWLTIKRLLSDLYRMSIRSYESDWTSGLYHVSIDDPYAMLTLYEIDPDNNGTLGPALDPEEVGIMAGMYRSSNGELVGGMLAPGKDGLMTFQTSDVFLQQCADALVARATIDTATANRLTYRWHPSSDIVAYLAQLDYTRSQLIVDRNATIGGKLSASNVSEIEVSQTDARQGDQGNWKKVLDATGSKKITARQVWDINPLCLTTDDWSAITGTQGSVSFSGYRIKSFVPWKFYHFISPWGGIARPCRVHHVFDYGGVQYGTPVVYNASVALMLATMAQIQAEQGLQLMQMAEYSTFADPDQTLMDVAFRYPEMTQIDTNRLGNALRLTPADALGDYTLNALLADGDIYQRGYMRSVMVRGGIDPERGVFNAKLYGRGL